MSRISVVNEVNSMRTVILFAVTPLVMLALPCFGPAQTQNSEPTSAPCDSNIAAVSAVTQHLSTLVSTVKNETQQEFETKYHQQTAMSRLNTCLLMTDELITCLNNAAYDPATPKQQMKHIEELQSLYTKLKTVLSDDIERIKGASKPEDAKAVIGKFDFTH